MTAVHASDAQSWQCQACSADWPCEQRQDQLHAVWKDTPDWIEQLMGAYLLDALAARPDVPFTETEAGRRGWL